MNSDTKQDIIRIYGDSVMQQDIHQLKLLLWFRFGRNFRLQ